MKTKQYNPGNKIQEAHNAVRRLVEDVRLIEKISEGYPDRPILREVNDLAKKALARVEG